MAEHSICQPKPRPHGLSHSICRWPGTPLNFHSAKSQMSRFSQLHALARLQAVAVQVRQLAVAVLARGVEIDAVRRAVGVALRFQVADEGDLLGDVVRGAAPDGGRQDIQGRRSPSNARVNSAAMSQADLPLRALRASILSSPLSPSDVRWPTSVMFITWRTCKPLNSSARRRPSTNR
jgi:hypothetical protein